MITRTQFWRAIVLVLVGVKLVYGKGSYFVIFAPWYLPILVLLLNKPVLWLWTLFRFLVLQIFTNHSEQHAAHHHS